MLLQYEDLEVLCSAALLMVPVSTPSIRSMGGSICIDPVSSMTPVARMSIPRRVTIARFRLRRSLAIAMSPVAPVASTVGGVTSVVRCPVSSVGPASVVARGGQDCGQTAEEEEERSQGVHGDAGAGAGAALTVRAKGEILLS